MPTVQGTFTGSARQFRYEVRDGQVHLVWLGSSTGSITLPTGLVIDLYHGLTSHGYPDTLVDVCNEHEGELGYCLI
jgi:hypothetical protein